MVATTPTACGIETEHQRLRQYFERIKVATTPTACGIETKQTIYKREKIILLQQHLPLAVLKPKNGERTNCLVSFVATTPTACGIETRRREEE